MIPNSSVNTLSEVIHLINPIPNIWDDNLKKIPTIPADIWKEIFLESGIQGLKSSFTVSREWNQFIKNSISFKEYVYKIFAFSPLHWNKFFGEGTLSNQEINNAFKLLPDTLREILKSPCLAFPGKTFMETHKLVWIPEFINEKRLSINSFDELLKQKMGFSKNEVGYLLIQDEVMQNEGDKPVECGFMLITNNVLPNSQNINYRAQQLLLESFKEGDLPIYRVPKIGEVMICTITEYLRSGNRLLPDIPWVYTRCQENDECGQVIVGGLGLLGLFINYALDSPWTSIGVVGLKKL